jgi:glycosyltransferase involved in cell wall biosynthesis/O-antigen/teichoic acid export membrane protein
VHILVLVDRDWTHPQGGGTGTNLYGQVARWIAWGHRVTVVSSDYPGAEPVQQLGDDLTLHHLGSRLTVFPRAAWRVRRRLIKDADVVLEVINGIAFFAPLWLRRPRVALVHHVHRRMYIEELGKRGALAALLLETLPLRFLYRATPFLTVSEAARADLVALGVPPDRIVVAYNGVEPDQYTPDPSARAPVPTLLYLGRLKRYKRIETVLDVLESIPEARLDIAGEGDHRPALEAEIEQRGLTDRVTLHGYVDEADKADLYRRAWVTLTASSAEGWCLTVMEAAACGTPSAALRVGGLPEAIVDGETGVLADDRSELATKVTALMHDADRREALGAAAARRAKEFTWERTAKASIDALEAETVAERQSLRSSIAASETAKALGLAIATLGALGVQLIFTAVFARLLKANGYGELAPLVSTTLILAVPGLALQVAAARETALGRLGEGTELTATHRRWMTSLAIAFVVAVAGGALFHHQLASVIGVKAEWAAAATPATGVAWLALSLERGIAQGLRLYRPAGLNVIIESIGRLVLGLTLYAAGAGVTGAFLGSPAAMLAAAIALGITLRRELPEPEHGVHGHPLLDLARGSWAPVLGLTLVAVLQNVDVIVVKHRIGGDKAGAYAAAAVAAKVVIFAGIGISYYLVPEAARAAVRGTARSVLLRGLVILSAIGVPVLAIYALVPALVLKIGFNIQDADAERALVLLGTAMTLLAIASLAIQYLLAIERFAFLWALTAIAVVEPFALANAGDGLVGISAVVLALQVAAAISMLAFGFRARARAGADTGPEAEVEAGAATGVAA